MAKSSGNVVLVSDLVSRRLDPLALRLCFLENRYRSQMDLSWDSLRAAHLLLQRWREKIAKWRSNEKVNEDEVNKFVNEIVADFADDLDTPRALQKLRSLEKSADINESMKLVIFEKIDELFGLDLFRTPLQKDLLPSNLQDILNQRAIICKMQH